MSTALQQPLMLGSVSEALEWLRQHGVTSLTVDSRAIAYLKIFRLLLLSFALHWVFYVVFEGGGDKKTKQQNKQKIIFL